jgi:hypothetical protein
MQVSTEALDSGKDNGTRERAWGGPVSPNFGVLARRNDELRRAILSAWRLLWLGERREIGEEVVATYRHGRGVELRGQ